MSQKKWTCIAEASARAPKRTVLVTYIWLYSPVVIEVSQSWMLVEKPTIPSTHVAVAEHPTFANPNSPQVVKTIHVTIFIDPFWRRPMFAWNKLVVDSRRGKVRNSRLRKVSVDISDITGCLGDTLNSLLKCFSLKNTQGY